jgi:apolipoprotein N-acyltransferase
MSLAPAPDSREIHEPQGGRAVWGVGLVALAIAIAWPNAAEPLAGFPAGDVSMLQRLVVVQLAAAVTLLAFHGRLRPALLDWGAVCLPAWAHVSWVPAWIAPLAFVALAWALVRARSTPHILLVAALSAATQILGAAGWIFHYFEQPLLPSFVAALVSIVLWSPASLLATRLCQRSLAWLPLVAACWPATEWIRGVWMSPPLPGLFLAHATADTGFVQLAPTFGELGVSFAVAAFAFAAAALLERSPRRGVAAVTAGALGLGAVSSPAPPREPQKATFRVCAVEDPHRIERRQPPFGGGGGSAVKGLYRRAVEQFGCDVTILPEYSLKLAEDELVSAEIGAARESGPVLLGGAYAATPEADGHPRSVRNVVCQIHENGAGFLCSDPLDKIVFAPFGEAALFHDSPTFAPLGRWLTERATGATFESLATHRGRGSVQTGERRFGGSICWEILVPGIFHRRGIVPGATDLLVVPSDLDGFGGSREGIEQFRRASRIHALRLRTPLVFASTHGAFLLGSNGELVPPVHTESFFAIWDVPQDR